MRRIKFSICEILHGLWISWWVPLLGTHFDILLLRKPPSRKRTVKQRVIYGKLAFNPSSHVELLDCINKNMWQTTFQSSLEHSTSSEGRKLRHSRILQFSVPSLLLEPFHTKLYMAISIESITFLWKDSSFKYFTSINIDVHNIWKSQAIRKGKCILKEISLEWDLG